MFEEKDIDTVKENIEMMNLNHMFQTRQYDKAKTILFLGIFVLNLHTNHLY